MIKLFNVTSKNSKGQTAYVLPSGITTTSPYRAIDLLHDVDTLRRSIERAREERRLRAEARLYDPPTVTRTSSGDARYFIHSP